MFFKNIVVLGPSTIHGTGLFAATDLSVGSRVFHPESHSQFFLEISREELFHNYSGYDQDFIQHYGYCVRLDSGQMGEWRVDFTDIRFINDSTHPTLRLHPSGHVVTAREIKKGEELTQDYTDFADPEWVRQERAKWRNK